MTKTDTNVKRAQSHPSLLCNYPDSFFSFFQIKEPLDKYIHHAPIFSEELRFLYH